MADQDKKKRTPRKKPVHHPSDFDLDIMSGDDDLFRWFLLTYLLGKPIQSTVAVKTWQLFIDRKLDLPWAILNMSDRQLVSLLHEGGYTRYQHVMTHAYYWGGGRDENWEPDMKELHQTLSHLVGRAELRQRLLCRALKRDIQRGKEEASS